LKQSNKVMLFLTLVLVTFLSIGGIFAVDTNDTIADDSNQLKVSDSDSFQIDSVDNTVNTVNVDLDDVNNASTNDVLGYSSENVLSESEAGSLTELKSLLDSSYRSVSLDKNYEYQSGDSSNITISKNLVINGNGFTINGKGNNLIHFVIGSGSTVTLNNLTICNFNCDESGGAIYVNQATLNINNCVFENNSVSNSSIQADGGAINAFESTLNVNNSNFTNNSASVGGAIYMYYTGALTVNNSIFKDNYAVDGGAIESSSDTTANVYNSQFINNATYYGGALSLSDTTTSIENSTFVDNTAFYYGGAISNNGNLTIKKSNFTNNNGGNGDDLATLSSNYTVSNSGDLDIYEMLNVSYVTSINSDFAMQMDNGYTAFCIEYLMPLPTTGTSKNYVLNNTSLAINRITGEDVSNIIKLLIVDNYGTENQSSLYWAIWAVTDGDFRNLSSNRFAFNDTIKGMINRAVNESQHIITTDHGLL